MLIHAVLSHSVCRPAIGESFNVLPVSPFNGKYYNDLLAVRNRHIVSYRSGDGDPLASLW